MSTNDGGPAFPQSPLTVQRKDSGHIDISQAGEGAEQSTGMTLRDWFAGMAMQALIGSDNGEPAASIANRAFFYSDAMLAEREGRKS